MGHKSFDVEEIAIELVMSDNLILLYLGWEGVGSLPMLFGRQVVLSNAQASDAMRLSAAGSITASAGRHVDSGDLERLAWNGELPTRPRS